MSYHKKGKNTDFTQKEIEKFRAILEKDGHDELSDAEVKESMRSLYGLADILFDCAMREVSRKQRLEDEPKGFCFDDDGHYTCKLCGNGMKNETVWYDKWGQKCISCQTALNKKIIPGFVFTKDDSYYSLYDLQSEFLLKTATINKLVKNGALKARTIPNLQNHHDCKIFIIKDNQDVLPDKKKLKNESYKTKDGYFSIIKWFEYMKSEDVLSGYEIAKHVDLPEPIYTRKEPKQATE